MVPTMAPVQSNITSRPIHKKAEDSSQGNIFEISRISHSMRTTNPDEAATGNDSASAKANPGLRTAEASEVPIRSNNMRRTKHSLISVAKSLFIEMLSPDVHYQLVTEFLDFDSLIALRQTCRQMRGLLTVSLIRRLRAGFVEDFLADESRQLCEYRQMYPPKRYGHLWDIFYAAFDWYPVERPSKELRCYGCLQTKPIWCFVERMSIRGTGLAGKLAKDRMCKDCMRRYRNLGGIWWKENWIKKSEVVRRSSRFQRWKRWAMEGQSLVNPAEEVGVCSNCGSGPFELWWGCAGCFESEQSRRREEDLEMLDGMARKTADVLEAWRVQKESWRRKRTSRQNKRRKWWSARLDLTWEGDFEDRKQSLIEWKRSKDANISHKPTCTGTPAKSPAWRAADQQTLKKDRREARCSICWIPNCPRRLFMIGLAYEKQLPPDRWCAQCQEERQENLRQRGDKWRTHINDGNPFEGLANLFDQNL